MFNVDLILHNKPIDAFQCLLSLAEDEVFEVGYVIKELQKPSPRMRRAMTEAIGRHQSVLIWRYLCKYQLPKLLKVRRGETISPLSLLLWAPYLVVEDAARCPRALGSLLAARCSPNELGSPERAPLSIAVGANDQESVEELFAYQADPDRAPEGRDPPLCVAVRHRMRRIPPLSISIFLLSLSLIKNEPPPKP